MSKERRIAIKMLTDAGYILKRHGANHDDYFNSALRKSISLKRHGVNQNTLRYIKNEIQQNAGL